MAWYYHDKPLRVCEMRNFLLRYNAYLGPREETAKTSQRFSEFISNTIHSYLSRSSRYLPGTTAWNFAVALGRQGGGYIPSSSFTHTYGADRVRASPVGLWSG
jgi:hypothetical protein